MGDIAVSQFKTFLTNLRLTEESSREWELFFNTIILPYLGDGKTKKWDSWVTDDNSPYDWSLVLTQDGIRLRIIWEPQNSLPTLDSMKQTSFEFLQVLSKQFNANTNVLQPILPFLKSDWAKNSWFATEFGDEYQFKIYFGGSTQEPYKDIMETLNLKFAFDGLKRCLTANHYIEGMSMDLADSTSSRVKLYIRLPEITPSQVVELLQATVHNIDDGLLEFLEHFFPAIKPAVTELSRYGATDIKETYKASEITLTYYFLQGVEKPTHCRVHLPVRFYFQNDQQILDKVAQLAEKRFPATYPQYSKIVTQLSSHRKLSNHTGIQSTLSYSCNKKNEVEFVSYISPELFSRQTEK